MIEPDLLLANYDYTLPSELIAFKPTYPKEKAKLLIFSRKENKIIHTEFGRLGEFLPKCEIIFNDTKVIKARIFAFKENGKKCEIFIHKALNDSTFLAQIKGKVRQNELLRVENASVVAKILALNEDGTRVLNFAQILQGDYQNESENLNNYYQKNGEIWDENLAKILNKNEVFALLEKIGHVPLPPYIKRADSKADVSDYQSIFAKKDGAVAAPTASLHFSKAQITELSKQHKIHTLTLHVGAGTFKGVEAENIALHKMHEESYEISENLAELILSKREILAVGTTVARCVEHFWRLNSGEFLRDKNEDLGEFSQIENENLRDFTQIKNENLGSFSQIKNKNLDDFSRQNSRDFPQNKNKNLGDFSQNKNENLGVSKLNSQDFLQRNSQIFSQDKNKNSSDFPKIKNKISGDFSQHNSQFFSQDKNKNLGDFSQQNSQILSQTNSTSKALKSPKFQHLSGLCDIFLHPKNPPTRTNYLLTNFHLPKSTLIMLVSAFIGREMTLKLYHEAIAKDYKFYSYGDAMLIL